MNYDEKLIRSSKSNFARKPSQELCAIVLDCERNKKPVMQDPIYTGPPDPEPIREQPPRWPRKSVVAAFSLIPIGLLLWIGGLSIGLGVGDAGGPHADVIVPIASYCFIAGLPIAAAGLVWLLLILLWDFVRR